MTDRTLFLPDEAAPAARPGADAQLRLVCLTQSVRLGGTEAEILARADRFAAWVCGGGWRNRPPDPLLPQGVLPLCRFLAERTERGTCLSVGASTLYQAYAAWCAEAGVAALGITLFGRLLPEMGIEKSKLGTVTYQGIRLLDVLGSVA